MTSSQPKYCGYCKGTGRLYRAWKRRYETCIVCDGSGEHQPPREESWREQRIRQQRYNT